MKLHISYNHTDLQQALKVAERSAEYADILGVGSLLIYREGVKAVKLFKDAFPNKEIFAETCITEKAQEAVSMFAQAGAQYVSVLAGTFHTTIKKAIDIAKGFDVKIALDLLDAPSVGQSALDARSLGVHMLIMHRAPVKNGSVDIGSEWPNVRGNTTLPIFITGKIDMSNFEQIAHLKPQGVMVGAAITRADDPAQAARYFKSLM